MSTQYYITEVHPDDAYYPNVTSGAWVLPKPIYFKNGYTPDGWYKGSFYYDKECVNGGVALKIKVVRADMVKMFLEMKPEFAFNHNVRILLDEKKEKEKDE